MFAEATNYIKRQTFNNSENWFKGDEHSYMIERKMAHLCLLQCLLTLQMFSCKSVDAASFLALTCWLNTPLLLWIAAFICWYLPALRGLWWRGEREGTWQGCSLWKQDVEVSGLHCWFWHEVLELFALPHWGVFPSCLSPWLFSIMCLRGADKPIWVVNFFALMVDFCTHKLITIISVIKTCLFVFFSPRD